MVAACDRQAEIGSGDVNIRLTFSPPKVSADVGTALVTVDVDNFSGRPVRLEDLKVNTSAGFEKVGAIVANSPTRFTVALNGLTDVALSPVQVTVNIGKATQTGTLEVVPGDPSGITLAVSKTAVSADEGEVDLTLRIVDKSDNLTPTAITLSTTAGVVSQLVNQPDGTYTAKLSGLVHTADSPVTVRAVAGKTHAEAVVQVLAGVLDHFVIDPVANPQVVGEFAPLYVTARDLHENLVTAFEEFVTVRTSRGSNDVDVSYKDTNGDYRPTSTFTRQFVLGVLPTEPPEEFRIRSAAATNINLVVSDASGKKGESNGFTVDPAPANQLTVYSRPGFNLIVSADGCVKPTVAGPECLVGATKNPDTTWKQSPLATRLELKLRRFVNSPDDPDNLAMLIGGRGAEIGVSMTDAAGNVYDANSPHDGPYLGPVEDAQNGKYYVNVYNLRDQARSPYTVAARFVSLVTDIDVSVVPGDLNHFSFPETPAQRGGAAGIFFTSITARDLWENQVFSFQDTTSVYAKVGNGAPVFLAEAPPTLLGATFAFAITIPESTASLPATMRLWAQHGSGVTGQSNPFVTTTQVHTTTDFLVLLPGQYDDPRPAQPNLPFFQGGSATLTPDLGQISSTQQALDQTSGEPFQVLVLARMRGSLLPVPDFSGKVLLSGVGSTIEVVDDSCRRKDEAEVAGGPNPALATSQGSLTPDFIPSGVGDSRTWVGAGTNAFTGYESLCYVWVRAVGAGQNVNILADAGRLSGIPFSTNGNASSNFRVRSAPAVSLRFDTIPSPQLATANPAGGTNYFSFVVHGLDADGVATDNVSCPNPVFSSSLKVGGVDPFKYGAMGAPAFDGNGVLRVDDAWVHKTIVNPENVQLSIQCGSAGMQATSNVFQIVSAGAVAYEFTLLPAKVKAHQSFTFSARACDAVDVSGKHCQSEDDVARSFSYPVSMTDQTGTLSPRRTKNFVTGVLDRQTATLDKVGSTRICLYAVGAYSCSDPIAVEYGDISYFQFDMGGFPSVVTVGDAYDIKLAAYDAGGNRLPDYKGKIYLSNLTNSAQFANGAGNVSSADVTTAVDGADGKTKLFWCSDSTCTTTQKLKVKFGEMSATDYLTITDGKGHTGYSLPTAFRVVYGPVFSVAQEPCVAPGNIRRNAYFALCATAHDKYGNVKKDYDSAGDYVVSASHTFLPDDSLPFIGGVAQKSFYVNGATNAVGYSFNVAGNAYAGGSLNSYAPITYSVAAAGTPPAGLKVNQAFSLTLKVLENATGLPDASYGGVLKVTDSTGSIRPACGTGEPAGTCGFMEADVLVSGNLSGGQRTQWFTISTEVYGDYLWVSDGFGQSYRVGPFDVQGNLKEFRFSALPAKIAADVYQQVTITAYDLDNQVMPNFKAPIQLQNRAQNVNPDNPPLPWTIPTGAWVNGQASISFRVPVANATPDYLTATYGPITTNSTNFVVETPVLTTFAWDNIASPQGGYVDFPVRITAKDQFNRQFLYSGTVDFTATNGFTVRPGVSGNFVNGVLGESPQQKIALDGAAAGAVVTATKTGGGPAGASNPVTVTAQIVSFAVLYSTNPKVGCAYNMTVEARDAQNNPVTEFSGRARMRWGNPGSALFRYATVGNENVVNTATSNQYSNWFTGGTSVQPVKLMANPPQPFPGTYQNYVNVYLENTAIEGWTTMLPTVLPSDTCP